MHNLSKLVILDRDGVINHDSDQFIKSPDEWKPLAGSIAAIAQLNHAGYRVVVATNQSGIGRGLFDMATLSAINDKMVEMVFRQGGRIDAVFFCAHTAEQKCRCRKPQTGMFEDIAARFKVGLDGVPMVGDALRDLQAASRVGGVPLLVLTGKGKKAQSHADLPRATKVFADLAGVAKYLADESAPSRVAD